MLNLEMLLKSATPERLIRISEAGFKKSTPKISGALQLILIYFLLNRRQLCPPFLFLQLI